MIRRVHVVVPARDEEVLLPRCLASIIVAMDHLVRLRPDVSAHCTVVLDRCVDGSSALVRNAGLHGLIVDHGVVGAARHSGVLAALCEAAIAGVEPHESWIACTDADSAVPRNWLTGQLDFDNDAVVGTVEPIDLDDHRLRSLWQERHQLVEDHEHVHGANLGVRGSTYLAVGGFAPMALHEDVDLVARIRLHTDRWVATDRVRVGSSGRQEARCAGGFAAFLTDIDDV